MKKIVQRMCMGCNNKKDKRELIRVVLNKNGEIAIDKTGKLAGRGAYICDSIECLEKAIKTKRLEKCFDMLLITLLISKFERTVKMTLSVDNLFRKLQEKTAGKLTNNPTIEEKNILNSTMRNRSVYSRDGYNRSLSSVNLNSVLQNDYISKKLSYVNNYV